MVLTVIGPGAAEGHHDPGHPERPDRIDAALAGVTDLHLDADLVITGAPPATTAQLSRVHTSAYLERLHRFSEEGGGAIDADTYATPASWEAARLAAGAGLAAVDVVRRNGGVAFVCARPPGHHAVPDRAMGFCLLNNVAVTARALVDAGERVVIVDWDVHHGNGTQDVFWDEPAVLYVSTHQWPCYPGTGRSDEVGGPTARGTTLNIPLPPGATGDVVRHAFDTIVTPAVDAFGPTWVLVSAGFDAHRQDPLAQLALSAGDFADLATVVAGYAPEPGRLILFLEGGYDLGALRSSVTTLGALVGAPVNGEPVTTGGIGRELVDAGADRRREVLDRLS
jgi:acetoin utilization deacetylase AcuC-like enzyme